VTGNSMEPRDAARGANLTARRLPLRTARAPVPSRSDAPGSRKPEGRRTGLANSGTRMPKGAAID